MPARKRTYAEATADGASAPPSLLTRIRNRWELAALYSFIYIFGDALKIDRELDMDMLEEECLKPDPSQKLADLGLLLLKNVSSHRGLTHDLFDEYTRRQYQAKAPHRNPFGDEEEPKHFSDFDVFARLRVLYQLAVWTFHNPDKIRERMAERDYQQAGWRIEHDGEDAQDRKYFVLDDNRLYRLTPAPLPPMPVKSKAKKVRKPTRGRRTSKRQRMMNDEESDAEQEIGEADGAEENGADDASNQDVDGFGEQKWECIAVTLDEYNAFLSSFKGTRHPEEKSLVARIRDKAMPAVEAAFEAQARKMAARARELATLEKMASAKRSSRISARHEKEREAQQVAEADRKKQDELAMAHREQERIRKMEEERESRMMTREQRLKEREMRRILHEEELAKLERASEGADSTDGRISERNRLAQMQKQKEELARLEQAGEDWDFDCSICGVHGKNLDDGSHSLACEKCGVWQHSKCHGLTPEQAEADDYHFVCASCSKPKTIKITNHSSPAAPERANGHSTLGKPSPKPAPKIKKETSGVTKPKVAKQAPPLGHFTSGQPGRPVSQGSHALMTNSNSAQTNGTHHQVFARPSSQAAGAYVNQSPSTSIQSSTGQQPYSQAAYSYQHFPPAPANHSNHHQYSRPLDAQPSFNPFANNFVRQAQQTPQKPASSAVSPATATPHLNATQGSTDVRFSPTHSVTPRHPSQSYSPTSNRPAPSAMSPSKQPSPPHPRPQQPSTSASAVPSSPPHHLFPPSPSKFSPAPSASATILPSSQNPGSSPLKASPQLHHQQYHPQHAVTQGPLPGATPARIALPPAPALSPSVNVGTPNLEPPVKKPTPEKQALPPTNAPPTFGYQASPSAMVNGVSGGARNGATDDRVL